MIIGIDHIAINTKNIIEYEKTFLNDSYQCLFKNNIPNNKKKKTFLKKYNKYHKIAYYESLNNYFPIELTEHGNDITQKETPLSFEKNTISIKVTDVEQEKSLWSELLQIDKLKNGEIEFGSILPNRGFRLNFIPVKRKILYTLDTEGCTCVALITTNIYNIISILKNSGLCEFVGPWISKVNNKKLIIVMFKTTGGIIVELIQLEKKE